MTVEEYDKLYAAQDGRCAICGTDDSGEWHWAVDHCHATGAIRGLLCTQCNVMIAMARDRTKVLRAAINYLEQFGAPN